MNAKGFAQGAFWCIITCFVSVCNDVISKHVGSRLDGLEISFLRFLFSLVTIVPFIMRKGALNFKLHKLACHGGRSLLGIIAVVLFTYALVYLPLAEVTIFSFTQTLFFMPLAFIFLKEKITKEKLIAIIMGFIGVVIVVNPSTQYFNIYIFLPILSAFFFALLDIIAKKMVEDESPLMLLFYFAVGTTIISLIPALMVWRIPTLNEILWLLVLGGGANLIQYTLLKAFIAAEASALAPFRYAELVFSAGAGFFLFKEVISIPTIIGAIVIILSMLYISYKETSSKKIKTLLFSLMLFLKIKYCSFIRNNTETTIQIRLD